MLILSKQTIQALGTRGRSSFEAELARHCQAYAPELCRIVGEAMLPGLVSSWVDRSSAHGFTLRGPTRLFAELAITFGSSFDTDPQLPWARGILADTGVDEMDRARSLFVAAHEFLLDTAGPDDVHSWVALRRIRDMASIPWTHTSGRLEDRILGAIREIHIHKARVVGDLAILELIEGARQTCKQYRLEGEAPVQLLGSMMFGFGHGIANDPLYPWVSRTLARGAGPRGDGRAGQLARKVMIYIDHMLARLEPRHAGPMSEDMLAEFGESDA